MTLQEQLDPIEADDLNDVLAVLYVDLVPGIEQGEEELQAPISQDDRLSQLRDGRLVQLRGEIRSVTTQP